MPIIFSHLATMRRQLASLALVLPCIAAQASNGLCAPAETVFFSCQAGKKIISLCASPDLSRDAGTLAYRFGTDRAHVEMTFPPVPGHPKDHFAEFSEAFAKGGTSAIGFQSDGFGYGVFVTRSVFGYNGAGVTVGRDGKRLRFVACDAKTINSDRMFAGSGELGIPKGDIDVNGTETVIALPPRSKK